MDVHTERPHTSIYLDVCSQPCLTTDSTSSEPSKTDEKCSFNKVMCENWGEGPVGKVLAVCFPLHLPWVPASQTLTFCLPGATTAPQRASF